MHARPFFVHPYAQGRGNYSISAERRTRQSSVAADDLVLPARRSPPAPVARKVMAEMKVSLAANQLSEQVKESQQFWRGFRDEYWTEVDNIKLYVGAHVLQQVWREKIEFISKDKGDDQQFAIQSMKLESCLNQVNEAIRLLEEIWSSDYSSDYDSRQHHLAKLRATGNLVVGLSKRSVTNEAACTDLLEELEELQKLIDSKSPTASILHRIGKRQSHNASRSEEGKMDDFTPNRSSNGEADRPNEHDYHEQGNFNGFLGNNEENVS
ncbi:hypothetical protein F5Y10DRAFT_242808 [Nemania abortiva]|nr:hypothetical protein F5Y10DRAFT_242808 [Nemania abortiva]